MALTPFERRIFYERGVPKAEKRAFKQKSKGGIDWWRYLTFVLLPKLLPFAQGLKCLYPGIVVQEDKAPSYTAKIHQTYYNAVEV